MPRDPKAPQKSDARLLKEEARFFENNLAYSIMVVANLIARITTQGALAGSGLTLSEWRVLRLVQTFGPMSAAEVISTIGMDKTTVSRMITQLHEAELIRLSANAQDRRQTLVSLTAAGTRMYSRIAPLDDEFDRSFESLLSSAELGVFREAMRKLRAHAQSLAVRVSAPLKKQESTKPAGSSRAAARSGRARK